MTGKYPADEHLRLIMRFFRLFLVLCLFPVWAQGEEILPLAQGKFTATFFLDKNIPRLTAGTTVEFVVKDKSRVPKPLMIQGFVLGTRDNAIFFEISERDAIKLAYWRGRQDVRFRKIEDPDPAAIAERRAFAEAGQTVVLAPRMRSFTVSVEVPAETVTTWAPGDMLTFRGAREEEVGRVIDGKYQRTDDIAVMFVSAIQKNVSHFEVTVVADPKDILELSRADAKKRLRIGPDSAEVPVILKEARHKCFVTQRSGHNRMRIEIPCD